MTQAFTVQRRALLKAASTGIAIAMELDAMQKASAEPVQQPAEIANLSFNVNGTDVSLAIDARTTLLDALREHLHLTGTKKGCNHGQCGACTVLVQDRRINSCLALAIMHDGDAIKTIEGFGTAEDLHPLQRAFIEHDGFQCGYCTSGQIVSASGVLDEIARGVPSAATGDLGLPPKLDDAEIRERMSGNLCRCAAYSNIVAAIRGYAGDRA